MIAGSKYTDGKLRCELCHERYPAYRMTTVVRPSGKKQFYCPACEERRWKYAETHRPRRRSKRPDA